MLESYILTGDGKDYKDYVDVDCVREALGIKEDEDIFRTIEKMKEERERYKSNCDYFAGIAEDKLCDRNKLELELREALGTVDEYADVPGLVRKLKKERDELKDRVRRLRIEANSIYGASCGYSEYTGEKAPAFRCNVISYSWEFEGGALHNGSIRVELDLTPTGNYKGTFDLEDLKKYIQAYGREKKLGIIESADYQKAKAARAELAYLYKTVLGKERLDTNLSPHEVMKAILDEYKRVRDSQLAFSQSLRSVYMHVYEGTGYNVSDIYAAPDKIADWIITKYDSTKTLGHAETLCDINDFIDELCNKYNVVQPDRIKTTRERLEYIFSVLSKKKYESLQEFRDNVCEIFDIPSNMTDSYILKEIHDIVDRYDELEDFRADICGALDIEGMLGTPKQNDKHILEQVEKLKGDSTSLDRHARFRSNVCTALCLGGETSDADILKRVRMTRECHDKLCKDYTELRKAIWEAMDRKPETMPEEDARLVGEVTELSRGEKLLIEFRDNIAKAMGMDYPTTNNFIVEQVRQIRKSFAKLHDDYIAAQKQVEGFTNRCDSLKNLRRDLWEFRKNAIENLKNRGFFFRPEENETLPEIYSKLLKRYDDYFSRYKEQSGLRQMWHARYESENERANGVQKKLDKLRGIEAERDKYKENCKHWSDMYSSSEAACGALKGKIRELNEEKTKVISALGQDIWDDCLK